MRAVRVGLACALVLACTPACYHVTIRSGRPPAAQPAESYDGAWRSAVIGDIVEIDKPVPLDLVCKSAGWAEIDQEMTPVNWLVDVFLAGFFYESNDLTLKCGAGPAGPPGVIVVPVQPGQTVVVQPVPGPGPAGISPAPPAQGAPAPPPPPAAPAPAQPLGAPR
jgi:hypothetical protein